MKFERAPIEGVWVLSPERHGDDRGFFARVWCAEELAAHGCDGRLAQCSVSYNERKGTLRGMHWQEAPHAEAKTVTVVRGAVFDVAVDLRPDSKTYLQWFAIELSAENGRALHVPTGCAHGFLTTEPATVVQYFISTPYVASAARGARFDDPRVGIRWPFDPSVVGARDGSWPALQGALG